MIGMRGNNPMFWLKLHVLVNILSEFYHKPWLGPLKMMTWIITNHYKSPQVYHDINHHKSQITTNHHKPWHKPPWTMTETSTKPDMNHYKSPQTMTWTIMMTQKELCIKPYGFLVFCAWRFYGKLTFMSNFALRFSFQVKFERVINGLGGQKSSQGSI